MPKELFSALDRGSSAERANWIDVMRGTAIVLVILFHAITVTEGYTGHLFTRMTGFLDAVQGLRMPLLFFLSGLLVPRSLRKGTERYVSGKVRFIAYPYVIWSMIMVVLLAVGGGFFAWDVSPLTSLVRVFYDPIEHLWFLAYLFIYYLLALLIPKKLPFIPVALSLVLYAVPIDGQWEVFWRFGVFFFVGVLAGTIPRTMDRLTASTVVNAVAVTTVGALAVLSAVGVPVRLAAAPWNAILAFWFFVGVAGLIGQWQQSRLIPPIAYVGRLSIVFYLAHWPIVLVTVRLLAADVRWSPWAIVVTSLAVTAVGTTALAYASERSAAVRLLFEWPSRHGRTRYSPPMGTALSSAEGES